MGIYKVSISAYKRSYDNGEIDQEDIDDIYYVEADSSIEALIVGEEIHVRHNSSSYICDSEATEITKDEIPSRVRFYTKKDILISKIEKLEYKISSDQMIVNNIKSKCDLKEDGVIKRIQFLSDNIKELQLELEKAKEELKNLEKSKQ